MKVLFVCGSLKPGYDGVGDYTRELVGALTKLGLHTKIIAIRDRNVTDILVERQGARELNVEVVRLSMTLTTSKRRLEFEKIVNDYQPEWISLQYVPYAFSAKGIPFSLPKFLNMGDGSIKWHFMIHESYINGKLNIKDQLIKKSQIAVLKTLVKRLNPSLIHTSTMSYKTGLSSINIQSEILGLFGNIPICESSLSTRSIHIFRGVYFGASPNLEYIQSFVEPCKVFLSERTQNLEIVFCGKSGTKGKQFADLLRKGVNSDRFTVLEKGRMNACDLSLLFQNSEFGIARIPPRLLGKSGSAIALLEHGLPLWVPLAKSKEEISEQFDFRVNQCFADLVRIGIGVQSYEKESRLETIAKSFLNQLKPFEEELQ